MIDLPALISGMRLSDSIVCWEPLPQGFNLVGQFSVDNWHLIFPFIHNNKQWGDYLDSMSRISAVRVLRSLNDGELYGFIFISLHNYTGKSVIFHGGGWVKSNYASFLNYRGLIVFLEEILSQEFKVVTSWNKKNKVAERFLRSLGFVPYSYTSTHTLAWINLKRLNNSSIYNKLKTYQ